MWVDLGTQLGFSHFSSWRTREREYAFAHKRERERERERERPGYRLEAHGVTKGYANLVTLYPIVTFGARQQSIPVVYLYV